MSGRKAHLRQDLEAARERTLWLLSQVPERFLKKRVHAFYSPIGWHFGHIARTEEYWIVSEALGESVLDEHSTFLFADLPENPKDNRVNLPPRDEILAYMVDVRRRTLELLEAADLKSSDPLIADGYAWEFALQHECQHQETICELLQLIQQDQSTESGRPALNLAPSGGACRTEFVHVAGGEFLMGTDDRHAYDNEHDPHVVHVPDFELAATPVTAAQWMQFMADNGYVRPELWRDEGWAWKEAEAVTMPEYWWAGETPRYFGSLGLRDIHPDEPVSCVSWFEADAFARWSDARLPTEEEWEYARISLPEGAAACHGMSAFGPVPVASYGPDRRGLYDLAGNVWEWTSSPFLPYPGFRAFPYDGYSKAHMDGRHRVCRGGSWATSPRILRATFRNWYVPSYRQGFLGLRLARG